MSQLQIPNKEELIIKALKFYLDKTAHTESEKKSIGSLLKELEREQVNYSVCPCCGSPLEVDEEYMQGNYGAAWSSMPRSEWVYYCSDEEECGEAGSFEELQRMAQVYESMKAAGER